MYNNINSFRAKVINVYTALAIAPKISKRTHKSNKCADISFRTGDAELIALASSLCLHVLCTPYFSIMKKETHNYCCLVL